MNSLFGDISNYFSDYFGTPEFQKFMLWVKLISYSISTLFIFCIIILLSRSHSTWWLKERVDSFLKVGLPKRTEQHWQKIKERIERGDDANLKLAIIEADNFFDDILKRMAFPGRDMGERLQQFEKHELKSIDLVWEAHRLRNMIVHQPNIKLTEQEVQKAVDGYEAALKELEVL